MSLTDQLAIITEDYIASNKPEDVIFDDNVLLYMLMSGSKFQDTLIQPGETFLSKLNETEIRELFR